LRAMGVPARASAGYAVPAANLGGGSSLLIKSGDAHEWAEIYLDTVGWVPVEVVPEKSEVKPSQFQEKDLQQLLGEMARKQGRNERESYQGPKLADAIRALLAFLPKLLLALIAIAYAWKLWRLAAPRFARPMKRPRIAYRAALDRLSAIGMLRGRGEPRERFAKRVKTIAPSFDPLTSAHVGVALGSRDALRSYMQEKPQALIELTSRVASEVRKGVPWWRWLLGVLNPISWVWSR
jgi:protein-glutamine gamma-glutamyltransferase